MRLIRDRHVDCDEAGEILCVNYDISFEDDTDKRTYVKRLLEINWTTTFEPPFVPFEEKDIEEYRVHVLPDGNSKWGISISFNKDKDLIYVGSLHISDTTAPTKFTNAVKSAIHEWLDKGIVVDYYSN